MPLLAHASTRLLIKLPPDAKPRSVLGAPQIAHATVLGQNLAGERWHLITPPRSQGVHPWDLAHAAVHSAGVNTPVYAEPDFLQSYPVHIPLSLRRMSINALAPVDSGDPHWPPPDSSALDWHLSPDYSNLRAARAQIALLPIDQRVRIAHLDTGYSDQHESRPQFLLTDAAWNFVENNNNAVDPLDYQGPLQNPGHGTATLALLAGNTCSLIGNPLGGAPLAEIVPVRIADSVVHFWTSAIAQGIQHALGWNCDLISLSMGGIPAQSWADMVNLAYESGCGIFAASGDSIGGLPTRNTVYPARFGRVTSVCGATYDNVPYFQENYDFQQILEGNFGPESVMQTSLATFTPNVLWALAGTTDGYSRQGAGTSAATPQATAAAALYCQNYYTSLVALSGWQKVEAIRNALFASARPGDVNHFGRGRVDAAAALNAPPIPTNLIKQPPDDVDFAFLKVLLGEDRTTAQTFSAGQQKMLSVEAVQLIAGSQYLADRLAGVDFADEKLSKKMQKEVVATLLQAPNASQTLQEVLQRAQQRLASRNARQSASNVKPPKRRKAHPKRRSKF